MVGLAPNTQHAPEVKDAAVVDLCTRTGNGLAIAQSVGVYRPTLYIGRINYSVVRPQQPFSDVKILRRHQPQKVDVTRFDRHL
jgi:hypothetical protein